MTKDNELFDACRSGDVAAIRAIMGRSESSVSRVLGRMLRPNIHCRDSAQYTPLHVAALHGHVDACKALIEMEANTGMRDDKGCTPLHLAALCGHVNVARLLLTGATAASRANVNAQALNGDTALHCGSQHGHKEMVTLLLKFGIDATLRNHADESALDLAAQYGRTECVAVLLNECPKLLDRAPDQRHPLLVAARNGHKDVVQLLLSYGADVKVTGEAGTALHEAALFGRGPIVTLLLQAGADAFARNSQGQTALDIAKQYTTRPAAAITQELAAWMASHGGPRNERKAVVLMDYIPSVYDETALALRAGDVVAVLETAATGRWRGTIANRTGYFPSTYVELLDAAAQKKGETAAGPKGAGPPPSLHAAVMYAGSMIASKGATPSAALHQIRTQPPATCLRSRVILKAVDAQLVVADAPSEATIVAHPLASLRACYADVLDAQAFVLQIEDGAGSLVHVFRSDQRNTVCAAIEPLLKPTPAAASSKVAPDEVKQWMEAVLKRPLASPLSEALRSGRVLCDLINVLMPGAVPVVPDDSALAVGAFDRALIRYGIAPAAVLRPEDLAAGNVPAIHATIKAVARRAARDNFPVLEGAGPVQPPAPSQSPFKAASAPTPSPAVALPAPPRQASLNPFLDSTPTSPLMISPVNSLFSASFPAESSQPSPPESNGGSSSRLRERLEALKAAKQAQAAARASGQP